MASKRKTVCDMSPIRITIGVLIGAVLLAAEAVLVWHIDEPGKWVFWLLVVPFAITCGLVNETQIRKKLRSYWDRACTGTLWRRQFPEAQKSDIREFLAIFVDAFMFTRSRRLCFSPDDKVMDVYRALYPENFMADSMELETFCKALKNRYGVDFFTQWRRDITLGEVFEQVQRPVV